MIDFCSKSRETVRLVWRSLCVDEKGFYLIRQVAASGQLKPREYCSTVNAITSTTAAGRFISGSQVQDLEEGIGNISSFIFEKARYTSIFAFSGRIHLWVPCFTLSDKQNLFWGIMRKYPRQKHKRVRWQPVSPSLPPPAPPPNTTMAQVLL